MELQLKKNLKEEIYKHTKKMMKEAISQVYQEAEREVTNSFIQSDNA